MRCRIITIVLLTLLTSKTVTGQEAYSQWGLSFSLGKCSARLKSGVGIVYPGDPYFAGTLVVQETYENCFAVSGWIENGLRLKNFRSESGISYSSVGFGVDYEYDYANSINNIVRVERNFHYLSVYKNIKYQIRLTEKLSLAPIVGFFIGYLVKSESEHLNYSSGGLYESTINTTSEEDRLNFGYEIALSLRKNISDYSIELKPYYNDYYKAMYGDYDKKVFTMGLAIGITKRRFKKSPSTPQ